jgi:hypothetical protein
MLDKLKKIAAKAKDAASSAAVLVGDLNGDGKVDAEDARIASEWAKKAASSAGEEAVKLGKSAVRSEMAKDAAAGAAIGAAVAVPIPVIGPITGAVVGAGVGVYKNLSKKGSAPHAALESKQQIDVHAELIKLDELRKLNIITEIEFEAQKKHILASRS